MNEVKMNQKSAAIYNRRLVLKLLRRHGMLTRIQLAEMTGLQGSTMSYLIRSFRQ